MSKSWKPGRHSVELRPSRIRRDPPPPEAKHSALPPSDEREAWTVIIGVILFALAITIIIIGASEYTSR